MKNVENKEKMTTAKIDDAVLEDISGGNAKSSSRESRVSYSISKTVIRKYLGADEEEEETKKSTVVPNGRGASGSW